MDTLQLIAEPKRRQILSLIWNDELAAGEIASRFDVSFAAISQHLGALREAELVSMRKDGNRRLYKARTDVLAPYKEILEPMWRDALGDLARTIEEAEG